MRTAETAPAAAAPDEAQGRDPFSTQSLAAKAELLELLLAATNDGVLDWNLVTGTTTYNPRWKNLLSYEGDELIETPTTWRELTHPDDLPKVDELLRDHLEYQWPFVHTSRMRDRHGGWRWILCRGCALRNAAGEPVRMVITFADITGRIRAEEQQRALVSAIPDTMFRVRRDGELLDLKLGNSTHASLFGALRVGKTLGELVSEPGVLGPLQKAIDAATTSGRLEHVEVGAAAKPGLNESYEIRVIRSGDDEAVCIVRDITEQRSMEAQLLQSQKLQAIGHLAAGIAHEINTPLQYVGDNLHFVKTAFADLLSVITFFKEVFEGPDGAVLDESIRQGAADKQEESDLPYLLENLPRGIDRALEGVERVTRIVRAMKAFSHPGTGMAKNFVNLNSLIENTVIVATNEWKYVAELNTELSPTLPPVPCVAGNIGQVVLNLVVNAAHAIGDVVGSAGGKGLITVSTAEAGDHAEIRVRDTGGGIPEAIRSKVFDPFFTTKPVGKGTGQGLAMAHATVVDQHRGTIHFESEVGKGTTFIIRLPLHVTDVEKTA